VLVPDPAGRLTRALALDHSLTRCKRLTHCSTALGLGRGGVPASAARHALAVAVLVLLLVACFVAPPAAGPARRLPSHHSPARRLPLMLVRLNRTGPGRLERVTSTTAGRRPRRRGPRARRAAPAALRPPPSCCCAGAPAGRTARPDPDTPQQPRAAAPRPRTTAAAPRPCRRTTASAQAHDHNSTSKQAHDHNSTSKQLTTTTAHEQGGAHDG